MRFSAVHKTASYLMVACAYGALVLSNELNSPIVVGGAVLIALSWFFEPPRFRPERWTILWNALAVAAFGYTLLSALSGGEWVVSGANLLVFLLVAKLFNRKSSRDYQVVYVLSFLMLVAGTTLNADLSYAVCFLGYVIFATWALILFHLRREMEDNFLLKHSDDSSSERVEVERILNSRRIVGPGFLAATSSVSLLIFFLSALMFFLFPRVGFGLFFHKSRSHMTFAGFSDGVTLGGHGLIRNDDTVVMRVKISDRRFQGALAPELHWRGVAFDRYARGKWSRSAGAFGTRARATQIDGKTRITLDAANRLENDLSRAVRQEIYLEPLDTPTLFAAATPVAFELENVLPGAAAGVHARFGQNDELRYSHTAGLRYTAYSDADPPRDAELAAAGDADARTFALYLQIPPEIPPRVIDLARRITQNAHGPYEKAQAVLRYLKANYGYTLEMVSDDAREPLDYFLFERKLGHCEYFSSAMAILLRAVGVPTRNVNGFLGGEWNEYGKYVAVRGGDAHSWVEVWLDGIGWVTFDPTPSSLTTAMGRGGGGIWAKLRRMLDTLRLAWFKWVLEFDLARQIGVLKTIAGWFKVGSKVSLDFVSGWVKRHKVLAAAAIPGGAGLVLLVGWWRRRRRAPAQSGRPDKPLPDHPAVASWLRAAKALDKRGFGRPLSRTPREHASELVARGAPGAAPFARLTELYYTARFSASRELTGQVDAAEAARLCDDVRRSVTQRTSVT